jgi:outer membrane protein OmpA-like peptidoglycan-associated protein
MRQVTVYLTRVCGALALVFSMSCAAAFESQPVVEELPAEPPPGMIEILEYELRTAQLLDATARLEESQSQLDDQQRRLQVICTDYPEHLVCQPQTEAFYAREAFCSDDGFTEHVDSVVASCHQGQCKQVDQAELLSRSDYMTLVSRLPHSLVTFGASRTRLDRRDKAQLQHFMEQVRGEKGYVIIVGRASRDGSWRRNIRLALDRAEHTRQFIVDQLGVDPDRVGFITYGHEKMYLTELDAQRLSERKMSVRQANRSALVFAYPCYDGPRENAY